MAYDSANKKMVLFGGFDGSKYDDTWVYDLAADDWTKQDPATKPSARLAHSMAYDSVNKKVVLFGGELSGNNPNDESWVYDLTTDTWTQKNPATRPLARYVHAMAYDSNSHKLVLFGGTTTGGNTRLNDTWIYSFHALSTPIAPDLTLTPSDISFNPTTPTIGDTVTINATIHNLGKTNATATVSFYDDDPNNGGALIGKDDIAVWANATAKAQIEWTPKVEGEHDIHVVVDDVSPGDGNEENNVASKKVEVVGNGVWLRMDDEPTKRAWPGMAYDSANKKVILFGGAYENDYKDDTWAYDVASNIWTTMNPSTKPSARERITMVYDSSNNLIILYGGCVGSSQFVDDTWVYDVDTNTWTEKNPSNHPNVEVEYALAYDSKNDLVVLFGGIHNGGGSFLDETWVYDVKNDIWTQKTPSNKPSGRGYFDMTYDSVNNKIVLFGGYEGNSKYSDETWLYDLKEDNWTQKNPTKKPLARSNHRMTYDPANNNVVLFGGQDGSNNDMNDTWFYDVASNKWTQKNPSTKPSARRVPGMAYDSANKKVVLFGGVTAEGVNYNDTWLYDYETNNWTKRGQVEKPDKRNMHAMAYDSKNEVTVMFGGALEDGSINDETWLYYPSNNTWRQMHPTKHPSARSDFSMVYNSIDGKAYLFGGGTDSGLSDETWAYDSSTNTWEDLNPTSKPSARQNYAMAYDSGTNKIVLFGGNIKGDIIDDTWVYDVSSNDWEEITISGDKPSKRTIHGMAYDPVHKKVILFGGYDDNYDNDTWVYDVEKETWERKYPTISPPPTCYINLIYNPDIKKTMFFGGRNEGDLVYSNEIWIYDYSINNWTKVNPKNKPHERARDPMVYDDDNDQLILFGGFYNDGDNHWFQDTWTYGFHTEPPSLTLTTSNATYQPGDTVTVTSAYDGNDTRMTFEVDYPNGSRLLTETIEYPETDNITFTLPTDAPAGTYTVQANTSDAWAETTFEVVEVVTGKPTAIIDSITPNFANPGTPVIFSGHGVDNDGTVIEYQWISSIEGIIGTESNFQLDNLSLGQHVISFMVKDDQGNWSDADTAILDIILPSLGLESVDVPGTISTGGDLTVNVDIHSSFDTPQDVILALQLENSENEPLDPVIETVTVQPDKSAQKTLTLRIDEDEPAGEYPLQVQAYLKLPRDEGFALDFYDDELTVTKGSSHRSLPPSTTTRSLVKGEKSFSLETDKDELEPGEEITIYANLSELDFPEGTAISFEILDPEMNLKYTRTFVTDSSRKFSFTIKTRDSYELGDYTIYASCLFEGGAATAETTFTLRTLNIKKIGELTFKLGELTAYRKEGQVSLDMGADIENFNILQTGTVSFALLLISSDFNPGLVPWQGDLYIFMGPETTVGLFIFNGHFYLWVNDGFVFLYTVLDNPDDDWSDYFSPVRRAGPQPLPLHISNQPQSLIDENFPDDEYELAIDIHELKGNIFLQLNTTDEYNIVSMYRGHGELSDDAESEYLSQGGKASLSDGGIYQSELNVLFTENRGNVDMIIDEKSMEKLSSHYHIPLNQTAMVDIVPEATSYHLNNDCLEYIISGKGDGVSPYLSSTTLIENNASRIWTWSSTITKDEEDNYHINNPSEMTFNPGSTKTHTIHIQENKEGETRSFVIRDMPAYEDTDSIYTVTDWDNLDNKEKQPVDYTHDGTTVGVTSDEEAAEVIEKWLDQHQKDVPDPNDEDSWLYRDFYGFPLYIYLVAIMLVVGMSFAYRRGKKEGKEEGKFYSKVEEQKKMKEVTTQTLQSLSSKPSTGFEPGSLTDMSRSKPGQFAPSPSLETPSSAPGAFATQGSWKCTNCNFTVDGGFSFCTKCGFRKNT